MTITVLSLSRPKKKKITIDFYSGYSVLLCSELYCCDEDVTLFVPDSEILCFQRFQTLTTEAFQPIVATSLLLLACIL